MSGLPDAASPESATRQGVWANAETLEGCRNELQEVLEGWIILGLRLQHTLPVIDGIELTLELKPLLEEVEVA